MLCQWNVRAFLYDIDGSANLSVQAINEAYELVSSWTDEEREQMRLDAAQLGLKAKFRDGTLEDIAKKMLDLLYEEHAY